MPQHPDLVTNSVTEPWFRHLGCLFPSIAGSQTRGQGVSALDIPFRRAAFRWNAPGAARSHRAQVQQKASLFGDFVFVVFALAQVADGCLTYLGVSAMGIAMEANPLIVWYMTACGVGVALTGAKVLAIFCGMALHVNARHRTVGALAVLCLGGAVWPWTRVLWP